jgi:hypothetical protein
MFLSRGTRAQRCDRCGRLLAPYTVCGICGVTPNARATAVGPDRALEDLIAAALPDPPAGEVYRPAASGRFDPEDVVIPRDADLFLGHGSSSRWRRML